MSATQQLSQNGLRVGDQIVAEGDDVSLGRDVGVRNDLRVGNTVYANRVVQSYVTKVHSTATPLIIDCNYGKTYVSLAANPTTISFVNLPRETLNFSVDVYIQQDVLGSRVMQSWPNNIIWPNTGSQPATPIAPSLQTYPFKVDIFTFTTFDGGVTWFGFQENPMAPTLTEFAALNTQVQSVAAQSAATNLRTSASTVVQCKTVSTYSTSHVSTASTSGTDLGLTITITPKFVNSKIKVEFFSTMMYGASGSPLGASLYRDIGGGGYVNLTPNNAGGATRYAYGWMYNQMAWGHQVLTYFDTPNTLQPITYKLNYYNHSGANTNYIAHYYMEYGWTATEISQ